MALQDNIIVDLFWQRHSDAITKTDEKYGKMLYGISFSVLSNTQDAEECVNDTYFTAWNRMPDERPTYLGAFLSKITRCLSIDKYRKNNSAKRGGGEICGELEECIPSDYDVFSEIENAELSLLINKFIASLNEEKQMIFVRRYFYNDSIEQISKRFSLSTSKVKSTLHRLRALLKKQLEEEML